MDTDIRSLELIEQDLQQVAAREKLRASAPPARRRSRMSWGTFAAAAVPVLVVAGLIGWLATGGVGSSNQSGTAGRDTAGDLFASTTAHAAVPAPANDQGVELAATGATGAGGFVPGTNPGPSHLTGDVSKIIRDGTMSIQVAKDDFSKGFASVTRIAENNGGFVLSSQTSGERAGTLTLRIPAKRFDDAMLSLRAIGTVQAQSVTGKDVTAQFIDLQARLRIAKSRRTVLLGLQSSASTLGDVLTVQRQLDDVQLQIEQIQGQINFIDDQVAQATIRVDLREKDAPTAQQDTIENPSLGSAWDRSVQGFLNVVSAVVIGLGYLIPIGILALALWLLTLAARRRRATS
jgi:Domain of unknown function (DUF4349)